MFFMTVSTPKKSQYPNPFNPLKKHWVTPFLAPKKGKSKHFLRHRKQTSHKKRAPS